VLQDNIVLAEEDYLHETILYESSSEMTGVLAVLIEREKLRSILNIFRSYSLDPQTVSVSGMPAITNFIRSGSGEKQSFKVVDISVRYAALYLIKNGTIQLVRSIPYDTRETAALKIDDERYEVVVENRNNFKDALKGLAVKVNTTIVAWQERDTDFENAPLFITGEASGLNEVSRLVDGVPNAEIRAAEWYRFGELGSSEKEEVVLSNTLFGNCLALGCGISAGTELLNFRKEGFSRRYKSKKFARIARKGLLLTGALLVVAVAGMALEYQQVKGERDELAEEVRSIYRQTIPGDTRIVDPVQQLRIKVNELTSLTSAAGTSGTSELDTVALLKDISERIPTSLQVTFERFIYDRETVRIRGTTENFNTVDQMKRYLDESSYFREVIIVSANVAAKSSGVRFELRLEL
jgi:Tfp pilus assembly protein PilN